MKTEQFFPVCQLQVNQDVHCTASDSSKQSYMCDELQRVCQTAGRLLWALAATDCAIKHGGNSHDLNFITVHVQHMKIACTESPGS